MCPPNATNTSTAVSASATSPLLNASRSPMCRNRRGACPSRAMKNSSRGKSLNAVFAASSRISAVVAWRIAYPGPLGNVTRPSWDSSVSSARGARPSRWISPTRPAKSVTSMATIQPSVVRALRHSVGRNAGTALETASMPVIDTAPEENARSTSSRPRPSAAGTEGGGSGAKPREAAFAYPTASTASSTTTNAYVGSTKMFPAVRTPRRFPASSTAITSTPSGTVHRSSPGSAEVTACTPAAIDTDTVST